MADHDHDCPGPPLSRLIAAVQRRWGTRALRSASAVSTPRSALPTGYAPLDALLEGGLPRGALTELLGAPTSGMTTLALASLARAQARGETAAYLDLPATFDGPYAAACGVALDMLLLARPPHALAALDLAAALLSTAGLLIVDARAGLPEAPRGSATVAAALRRLGPALAAAPAALVVLSALPAADPQRAAHATPLAYAAALRLHVRRVRWEHVPGAPPACRARVTILARRSGAAGGAVELPIAFPADWGPP